MPLRKRMRELSSGMKERTEMPEVGKHRPLAMAAAIVTLCIMGIVVFIWMMITGWEDEAGIAVGTIFVLLAASQCAVAVYWWRSIRPTIIGIGEKSEPQGQEMEFKEVTSANEDAHDSEKAHMLTKDEDTCLNRDEQKKSAAASDAEVTIEFSKNEAGDASSRDNETKKVSSSADAVA